MTSEGVQGRFSKCGLGFRKLFVVVRRGWGARWPGRSALGPRHASATPRLSHASATSHARPQPSHIHHAAPQPRSAISSSRRRQITIITTICQLDSLSVSLSLSACTFVGFYVHSLPFFHALTARRCAKVECLRIMCQEISSYGITTPEA